MKLTLVQWARMGLALSAGLVTTAVTYATFLFAERAGWPITISIWAGIATIAAVIIYDTRTEEKQPDVN